MMDNLLERTADNLFSIVILVTWIISEKREKSQILTQCREKLDTLLDRVK